MEGKNHHISFWMARWHLQSTTQRWPLGGKKNNPRKQTGTQPQQPVAATTSSSPPDCNGSDVMQMICKLLVIVVHHCHIFEQWKIIWNLLIKKTLETCKSTNSEPFISSKLTITCYSNGLAPRENSNKPKLINNSLTIKVAAIKAGLQST